MGFGAAAAAPLPAAVPEPAPFPTGLSENVEVRLVTIDVTPLDSEDRTVPGLGKEAFRLFVDGEETPIDTLDAFCGEAPEPEPRSQRLGEWTTPPDLETGTRRLVLAFDYTRLPYELCPDLDPPGPCMLHTQALEAYRDMVAAKPEIGDEEIMIVALTGGLRVEQPFTRDRQTVLATLRRMEYDVTLYAGHFELASGADFFAGLEALSTLLHATPGPKSIVLLTAGEGPAGSEGRFARLATVASDAQARIYPVDCRGLFGPVQKHVGSVAGGSVGVPSGNTQTTGLSGLVRLASMTGGRVTVNSNDFTMGYARARRDLGCRYTVGFYDRKPEENRTHALRVEAVVPGVGVHHADSYSFPSPAARHARSVRAAYMVPTMFEGGGMRAQVFPMTPHDRRTWDALVTIDFPMPSSISDAAPLRREFGAVLAKGPKVVKQFARTVTLQVTAAHAASPRRITFVEPARLSPGRYTLTAVLSDPGEDAPFTARLEMTVPDIPKKGAFLVGPMIGRRSGADVVIRGREDADGAPLDQVGSARSFRPLIVTETDRSEPLFALTEACVARKDVKAGDWRVDRGLATDAGAAAGAVDAAIFPARDRSAPLCESYLDEIPVHRLRLGGYTFSATLRTSDPAPTAAIVTRSATFLLTSDGTPDRSGGR